MTQPDSQAVNQVLDSIERAEHPRNIARERVADYHQRRVEGPQTPPPVGSIRRVHWSASKRAQRGLIDRIKSYFVGKFERAIR